MNDWRRQAIRFFSLIHDLSAIYILSVPPFLIEGRLPSPGPQAAAVLAAGVLYVLLRRIPKAARPVSAAAALAVGLVFGLTWFHAAFLGIAAAWRLDAHAGREPQHTEFFVSFISITYGLAALLFIGMNDAGNQLLKVLIIQFAAAVAIRTARSVYAMAADRKKQDRAFCVLAAGLMVLTLLSINLEALLAMIGASFSWLLSGLGRVFGVLSYPILFPLDGVLDWLDIKHEQMQDQQSEMEGEVPTEEEFMYPGSDGGTRAGSLILFLLLGSALVTFTIYLFRNYSGRNMDPHAHSSSGIRLQEEKVQPKRKISLTRNPVRREVQRLERKMARKGYGRKPDQTFADWLLALGVSGKEASGLKDVYARVRYGEETVSRQEAEDFRKRIRKIGKTEAGTQ